MANGTIPGTGLRTRSPLTNARDVARQYDGTSISDKTISDLRAVAVLKAVGPVQNASIVLPTPILGVSHILAYTTTTGVLLPLPIEGTGFTVIPKNPDGFGEVVENNVGDQSAETWIIHYQPDAPDIDIPQNVASVVTPGP